MRKRERESEWEKNWPKDFEKNLYYALRASDGHFHLFFDFFVYVFERLRVRDREQEIEREREREREREYQGGEFQLITVKKEKNHSSCVNKYFSMLLLCKLNSRSL